MKIKKIYVLTFNNCKNGNMPYNMWIGLTYYTHLQLGNPKESFLLPCGSFFKETGGQWIFVLSADVKTAENEA